MADNRRAPTPRRPLRGTNLALAGNRSRLAGKNKRGPLVRPHELRRVAARGEFARKRRRALRGEAAASRQPRVLCRPFLARRLGGGAGGMRMRN